MALYNDGMIEQMMRLIDKDSDRKDVCMDCAALPYLESDTLECME